MKPISAVEIDSYQSGRRRLMVATTVGVVPVMTKAGVVDAKYSAGDIILADDADNVVVGPVTLTGAIDLAERILEGDQRAATDPKALLALAAAVAGLGTTVPKPDSLKPQSVELAAPAEPQHEGALQ